MHLGAMMFMEMHRISPFSTFASYFVLVHVSHFSSFITTVQT